jgi:hypothetical protein
MWYLPTKEKLKRGDLAVCPKCKCAEPNVCDEFKRIFALSSSGGSYTKMSKKVLAHFEWWLKIREREIKNGL